jgi:hypothetical protein
LRAGQQYFAQNPNEISAFDPKLELRNIPGKSAQRGRQTQRFRWSIGFPALQNPARQEIVRITLAPSLLLLLSAGDLATRISTSSLTGADSRIG